MATEYGIFTDEGKIEGDFYDVETAEKIAETTYADDDAWVAECCPDHPENERESCEACSADEDDEDGED